MAEIILEVSDDQSSVLRQMGVKDFGLPIDCTVEDVLNFIVKSNTESRSHQECNERWNKLDLAEKREKLQREVTPIE